MDEPLKVYIVTEDDPLNGYEDMSIHRRPETACQRAKELMEKYLETFHTTGRKLGSPTWEQADGNHWTVRVNDEYGLTSIKYLVTPVEVEP